MGKLNMPFLVIGIFLVLLAVGFAIFAIQTSETITETKNLVSTNNTVISDLRTQQLTYQSQQNSQITSLSDQLKQANSQIADLNTQISAANTQITTANSQLTSFKAQLATTTSDEAALKTQISGYAASLTSLQTQIASINSTLTSLQNQIDDLDDSSSSSSTLILSSKSITQDYNEETLLKTFYPDYDGYIRVSGTCDTDTGYIRVVNTTEDTDESYDFTSGDYLDIDILAGTVKIYFGNDETSGTDWDATLTIRYYPD